MNMRIDPFDPELLSAYQHVSRLYPGLSLNQFRLLWQEAGDFMDEALEQGYEPEDIPALYIAVTAAATGLVPSGPESRPPAMKNGPRRLENESDDVD
jgi:hypothetical protein